MKRKVRYESSRARRRVVARTTNGTNSRNRIKFVPRGGIQL